MSIEIDSNGKIKSIEIDSNGKIKSITITSGGAGYYWRSPSDDIKRIMDWLNKYKDRINPHGKLEDFFKDDFVAVDYYNTFGAINWLVVKEHLKGNCSDEIKEAATKILTGSKDTYTYMVNGLLSKS